MSTRADLHADNDRALAELRDLGLAVAREAQARLADTPDARDFRSLTLAFAQAARMVRQSVALSEKLIRDRKRQETADAAQGRQDQERRVSRRKAQVKAAVEGAIRERFVESEADPLASELEAVVDEEALYDDFADGTLEAHIQRLCALFEVPAPKFIDVTDPPPATKAPVRGRWAEGPEGASAQNAQRRLSDGPWRGSG